ncbi:C39 family peptidase [Streptomyces sp. NPDC059489]|uniref:C39 family peptidase n=1 Tax=Streptomyces sp. NPDC059489 TaxID=3346849 RepID=UPI0036B15DA4
MIVHPVPYFSQWESSELVAKFVSGSLNAAEDPLWRDSGAPSAEDYAFWSRRLCGVACLRMALRYWTGESLPAFQLAQECMEAGAYRVAGDKVHGLIYAPFATYVKKRWGLPCASRPKFSLSEVRACIERGGLPLLSVHPSIRTPEVHPPHQGGHLVLGVGCDEQAIVLHNPSGLKGVSQEFFEIDWARFDTFYAGRGVEIGPVK